MSSRQNRQANDLAVDPALRVDGGEDLLGDALGLLTGDGHEQVGVAEKDAHQHQAYQCQGADLVGPYRIAVAADQVYLQVQEFRKSIKLLYSQKAETKVKPQSSMGKTLLNILVPVMLSETQDL